MCIVTCQFTTLLVFFYYIIKNLMAARRQDLGGENPLFATPQNAYITSYIKVNFIF